MHAIQITPDVMLTYGTPLLQRRRHMVCGATEFSQNLVGLVDATRKLDAVAGRLVRP